jgi:hypothetical protein
MNGVFETLAFALVIAGQFLAAIFLISRRKQIYSEPNSEEASSSPTMQEHSVHAPRIA